MEPAPHSSERVRITTDGACPRELPFIIGVLADFSGTPKRPLVAVPHRPFVGVTLDTLDPVLDACTPGLTFRVENRLSDTADAAPLSVDLEFHSLADFHPDRLIRQIRPLRDLIDLRAYLIPRLREPRPPEPAPVAEAPDPPAIAATELHGPPGLWSRNPASMLLDTVIDQHRPVQPHVPERQLDWREQLTERLLKSESPEMAVFSYAAQMDKLVSAQLSEVLHHPDFQRLEAVWRGLEFLLRQTHTFPDVGVRILNVSKQQFLLHVQSEPERDQSALFRLITEDAVPFSLLIGAYEIGPDPRDLALAQAFSELGAAAHAPAVLAASPDFPELAPEARYLGLVLPRVLLRVPYTPWQNPAGTFKMEEAASVPYAFLWGSAAWAFAARKASEFHTHGYFGVRDAPTNTAVQLPVADVPTPDGDRTEIGPLETAFTDVQFAQLRASGFSPMLPVSGPGNAAFFDTVEIDTILNVSRIAHYIRAILQDRRARFTTASEYEQCLHAWIAPYLESPFPIATAEFHVTLRDQPNLPAVLEASLTPQNHPPVRVALPIVLPRVLPARTPEAQRSRRDRFLRGIATAEGCISDGRLDSAIDILEDLAAQIERHRLDEWESAHLVLHVWELLRHCYNQTESTARTAERMESLARSIQRLHPG